MIHSGLYYRPGSLKAINCVAGRDLMYGFCEEEGVPVVRSGKLVVATSPRTTLGSEPNVLVIAEGHVVHADEVDHVEDLLRPILHRRP